MKNMNWKELKRDEGKRLELKREEYKDSDCKLKIKKKDLM